MPETDGTQQRPQLTQREALEGGYFGDFAQALHKAAESGDVWDLVEAFGRADDMNQALMEEVFPGCGEILRTIYSYWPNRRGWRLALSRNFKRLRPDLDGPAVVQD